MSTDTISNSYFLKKKIIFRWTNSKCFGRRHGKNFVVPAATTAEAKTKATTTTEATAAGTARN